MEWYVVFWEDGKGARFDCGIRMKVGRSSPPSGLHLSPSSVGSAFQGDEDLRLQRDGPFAC